MTESRNGEEQARWAVEVLRRASAVLHGRMVGVWEVSPESSLIPVVSNVSEALAWDATPEVREALRHLAMPAGPGSRWVAGRVTGKEHWCVAPVRDQVPAPPPHAQERRSRERLALELAGLCLGLSSHGAAASGAQVNTPDLFQRFTEQLGEFAQEIGTPLGAARQAVARSAAAISRGVGTGGAGAASQPPSREQLAEDLRSAGRALEQAVALVKTVQERARAVVATGGSFDVVQAVWACVDAERAQAALRGVTLELKTLAYVVSVPGDAEALKSVLATALHAAVEGLKGRVGTVRVSVENVGPVAMLAVRSPAVEGLDDLAAAVAGAKQTVERTFGGTLTVAVQASEGTTLTVAIPVPSQRFRDPALWWER